MECKSKLIINITENQSGKTVLDFVRYELGLSRRILVRLKQTGGGISVNGQHVTVRAVLCAGDVLELLIEDDSGRVKEYIKPYDYPADIVYEDEYLVAVNKPPDMPTHPSHGHLDDTLANVMLNYYKDTPTPFIFRPVNRLDRDTSGLVLICKDQLTAHKMSALLKSGRVHKQYLAVLSGKINPLNGRIETYIKRVSDSIIMREAVSEGIESEHAVTEYECIASNDEYSIVNASPITGRTHQLRVHFAHLGYPICGDTLYGTESSIISRQALRRQALHSYKLEFPHPYTGEILKLTAPIPEDIRKIYEAWFNEENK
jgi:pseudouridine synthase, RluA family